jgi:biopolymer transport protein ExbD
MSIKFTAACIFAFIHVAMAQGEPPDAITDAVIVRISADGVCYFLNDSAPCEQLGKFMLTKHLPQNTHIHIAVDRASKYELVAATLESLEGTSFKLGFINADAPASPKRTTAQIRCNKT